MNKSLCPLCGKNKFFPVVYRENVPVHQNFLCQTQNEALHIERGTLDIQLCVACGFIFNRSFEIDKLDYSAQYENKQYCSAFFKTYLDQRIHYLLNIKGLNKAKIIDVGCGQGHFLKQLIQQSKDNIGIGFDPSYRGPARVHERLCFVPEIFDGNQIQLAPDVILSRHVIEHIAEPRQFLEHITNALESSTKQVQLFFETPCIDWILDNQTIWDFFYEHCSYFSQETLSMLFNQAGYTVKTCKHVFGGQYLWLESEYNQTLKPGSLLRKGEKIEALKERVINYRRHEQFQIDSWKNKLKKHQQKGGVALWGAGAKGVTMSNLIDPQADLIKCVIDINPQKQACFIPGTGHPILAPDHNSLSDIQTILLMNPNYHQECISLIKNLGLKIDFILG